MTAHAPDSRAPHPRGDVTLRPYRAGDEVGIVEAFNRIFGGVDPNFRPRTLAHWRWEFAENPAGFEAWLAVMPEDGATSDGAERVVGQYAAWVQPVLLEGRPATFLHGVDSMTDPAVRRSLAKGGVFARLGNAFLDHFGGEAPERVPVIWGPPVPSAWRIGKTQIRYVLVRTQTKLVLERDGLAAGGTGVASGIEVTSCEAVPEDVGEPFERFARAHGAIVVRDRARTDWRFFRHPERRYTFLAARRGGALVGYCVATRGDFDGETNEMVLCDWVVPASEGPAGRALLGALVDEARAQETSRVTAVLSDTARAWLDLQEAGFRVRPTGYLVAARVYDARYEERWLHRNFYYTLGDMDLI